jgi:hypothetical protein
MRRYTMTMPLTRTFRGRLALGTTAVVLALGLGTAGAQGVPGVSPNKCLTGKTKCVDKKVAGLLKCREKCQKEPLNCGATQTACEDKVIAKFDGGTKGTAASCFGKLEAKQNGGAPETICTTTEDLAAMEAKADAFVADTVATLEGSPPPACGDGIVNGAESCDGANLGGETCVTLGYATGTLACTAGCGYDVSGCVATTCGNGTIESPESCDGANLGGATCVSLGFASGSLACTAGCGFDVSGCVAGMGGQAFPATGQTTCWNSSGVVIPCAGTGHDGEVQAGATLAYLDNGDGTITDSNTGLMWEKKSDDGSINDWDNTYSWDNAFAVHVATLNGGAGFADHKDWRVPNVKELQSIVNYQNVYPAVSPAFNTGCAPGCTVLTCSCTVSGYYWSASTYANSPDGAWGVLFGGGGVDAYGKSGYYVRAVRAGL